MPDPEHPPASRTVGDYLPPPAVSRHPYRPYYTFLAGLLAAIILIDLSVIGWRKMRAADLHVDRSAVRNYLTTLDPNEATVEELRCLPGLTDKTARAVYDYRCEHQRRFPDQIVFRNPEDLERVKGVSEKTRLRIEKYLSFPNSPNGPPSSTPGP